MCPAETGLIEGGGGGPVIAHCSGHSTAIVVAVLVASPLPSVHHANV